jgi:hypothetical protein
MRRAAKQHGSDPVDFDAGPQRARLKLIALVLLPLLLGGGQARCSFMSGEDEDDDDDEKDEDKEDPA